MEKNIVYDLIILGAGPVGLFSASLAGDYGMKTLIIESSHDYGGNPVKLFANKYIHDFPTYKKIKAQTLINKLYNCASQYQDLISFQYNTLIEKYYFDNQQNIHLVDAYGNDYCSKFVLLTIGKGCYEFIKPDIKNIDQNSKIIYSLNHFNNELNHIKKIIVLGGGDGAVDIAIHLARKKIDVTLIHRNNKFRAKGNPIEKLHQHNIHLLLDYTIQKIDKNELIAIHNETNTIKTKKYDLIIVQYGLLPLHMPIHSWQDFKMINKKYIVDKHFKTNVDGFYAAGSCVEYENRKDLIITGIGEATIAINDIYIKLYGNKKCW